MFCGKCGAQVLDDAKFCPCCGEVIVKEAGEGAVVAADMELQGVNGYSAEGQKVFVSPEEQLLGKLGNGYLVNLLFHKTKKCNALLTDKRVYLQGTMYTGTGKTVIKTTEERVLDLEDVTGTGFVYQAISKLMLVIGILLSLADMGGLFAVIYNINANGPSSAQILLASFGVFLGCVPGILFILLAILKSRKAWFFIDYAGGSIKVNASLIGLSDVQDFHKQMRRAKDAMKGKK